MKQIVLKPRKAAPFFGRHPWVLESAIEPPADPPADGEAVDLLSDKGKWIARGVYNGRSRIRVRLYSWDATQSLDESFWQQRLESALELRQQLGYMAADGACRLVFSEADGLSGLIVDRYRDQLVIQVTSLAMAKRIDLLVPLLVKAVRPKGITLKSDKGVIQAEGMDVPLGAYWGQVPEEPILIRENGLSYGVDLREGQKTGFYLDQRENRRRAADFAKGRRVLDLFCYSGGFAIAASTLGHAKEVWGVDSSPKAIVLAKANAERNEASNVHFLQGEGFDVLQEYREAGQRYDLVILDPPKFTQTRRSLEDALKAYHRINRLAMELLNPGGFLVTCSCSGQVTRDDFLMMLVGASQKSGRQVQVLEQRGPAPDHPVSTYCLEVDYLKCFICRVV